MESTPYWKIVWETISGNHKNVQENQVNKLLALLKDDILAGITQYKYFTENSYVIWKKQICSKSLVLEKLIHRLSVCLNLDSMHTWSMFCNYLIYEYFGKISDIQRVARYEIYTTPLLFNVWEFYTSERMFQIKTLLHILEGCSDKKHRFHKQYYSFIESTTITVVRAFLLKQLEYSIGEITSLYDLHCLSLKDWVNRNNREQLNILFCIIISMGYEKVTIAEFKQLFTLFKEHNFTSQPCHFAALPLANPNDLGNIRNAEIGAFLIGLEAFWKNADLWVSSSEEIENMILELAAEGGHSVLLLTWAALQMTLPDASKNFNATYNNFTAIALKNKVFMTLYEIASNPIFENCYTGLLVKKSMYTLLNEVCTKFNDDGAVYVNEGSILLLRELLLCSDLAHRYFNNEDEGIKSLYKNAAEMFPHDFESLTCLVEALLSHKSYVNLCLQSTFIIIAQQGINCCTFLEIIIILPRTQEDVLEFIVNDLLTLQTYAEIYLMCSTKPKFEDVININKDYTPITGINLVFPAGTKAVIIHKYGKTFVIYHSTYNYFEILNACRTIYLSNMEIGDVHKQETVKTLTFGYRLILKIFKTDLTSAINNEAIMNCLSTIDIILLKCKDNGILQLDLLKICFEICLITTNFEDVSLVCKNPFLTYLPTITHTFKVEDLFLNNVLNYGILLNIIKEEEDAEKTYDVLLMYLKFVQNHANIDVQVPGFIFMLLHVFPSNINWSYMQKWQKEKITLECLCFLLKILQKRVTQASSESDKIILKCCLKSLLQPLNNFKILTKIIGTTSTNIQKEMEKGMNWKNGPSFIYIDVIKTSMTLILLLLKLKQSGSNFRQELFKNILGHDNTVNTVAGYLNHAFDLSLPRLACSLLRKFAEEPQFPLLPSLKMECHQVQFMFFEKLRNPLVDESLKVAILSLINTCVRHQYGMTAAFFNLCPSNKYWDGDDSKKTYHDSISGYMMEYFCTSETSEYFRSLLQRSVLELVHTLWINQRDQLVHDLTKMDIFWENLTAPLFQPLILSCKTYAQIFNVITIEIFNMNNDQNIKLKEIVLKLFNPDNQFVESWTKHILFVTQAEIVSEVIRARDPLAVYLLKAWKNFIQIARQFIKDCFGIRTKSLLFENCLNGMISHLHSPHDVQILTIWAELYLVLITKWSRIYLTNLKHTYSVVIKVFQMFYSQYNIVGKHCQQTMLSIAVNVLKGLEDISNKAMIMGSFLEPIGIIIQYEYDSLSLHSGDNYINWKLLLTILNNLLCSNSIRYSIYWFRANQILAKIETCTGLFMNINNLSVATLAIKTLINYVRSPLAKDVLCIDFESFYSSLIPPTECINHQSLYYTNVVESHFKQWWITYNLILIFNTMILKKFGKSVTKAGLLFVHLHLEVLTESIKLCRSTAEVYALKLVSSCLEFCNNMLRWKEEREGQNFYSFDLITSTIKECMNTCIGIVLRPGLLKFFTRGKESKFVSFVHVPTSLIVPIMNELVNIIALAAACFLNITPSLLDVLGTYGSETCVPDIIGIDFRIPKINEISSGNITYGSLLGAVHFLCRTLGQINIHKRETGHQQKREILVAKKSSKLEIAKESPIKCSPFVTFVRPDFISVGHPLIAEKCTSIQLLATPEDNEWLTHLDKKKLTYALECINTLLAEQAFLMVYDFHIDLNTVHYIRRELYSELQVFYDFLRRSLTDEQHISTISSPEKRVEAEQRSDDIITLYQRKQAVKRKECQNIGEHLKPIWDQDIRYKHVSVPFTEEDYLFMISHWFITVCQLTP